MQIFTFDNFTNKFAFNYGFSVNSTVSHISVANDHSLIVISSEDDLVHIYMFDGVTLSESQVIDLSSRFSSKNYLSDDHQYLILSRIDMFTASSVI